MVIDNSHEKIGRSAEIKSGSNRAFGVVFAIVFLLVGLFPLIKDDPIRPWAVITAITLLVISLTVPSILSPFNWIWFKFGLLLHRIISPVIMGILFYLIVTPMALIMGILGKRPLSLSFDKTAKSYWIHRDPPGPEPKSMERQF